MMRRAVTIIAVATLVVVATIGALASQPATRIAVANFWHRLARDPVGQVDPEMQPATTTTMAEPQPLRAAKPPCRKQVVTMRYGRPTRCDVQPGQVLVMTFPRWMPKPHIALICDHYGGDVDSGDCYGLDH